MLISHEDEMLKEEEDSHTHTKKRPKTIIGKTVLSVTAHGKMYVTINFIHEKPYEIFAHIGKEGGDLHAYMSGVTRMVSIALRYGTPMDEIIDQLKGITCHPFWEEGVRNEGPLDALAQVLTYANYLGDDKEYEENEKKTVDEDKSEAIKDLKNLKCLS